MGGRTPLFSEVATLLGEAHRRNQEAAGFTRREVLRGGTAALAGLAVAALPVAAKAAQQPKITIVGAGIAGLNAAWYLQRAGLASTIYEASDRVGGRIRTARNVMGGQLVTEVGGEFIDSGHKEMLRLAQRYQLDLLDLESPSEQGLAKVFYFTGQQKTEAQVIDAFRPLAKKIALDQKAIDLTDYTSYNQLAYDLDNMSLPTYLDSIEASGFIRKLLEVAYLTEYGGELEAQTALNLIYLIGTKTNQGFEQFGASDQRYKVAGGNDQITAALDADLDGEVKLGHKLVAISRQGDGFRCTFQKDGGGMKDVSSDFLLLTLPFSVLRDVDIQFDLPLVLRRYIAECGYGSSSKLVLGFDQPYWRAQGKNGLFFTDLAVQSGWDSSQLQSSSKSSLTIYTGGNQAVAAGNGSVHHQRNLALPLINQMFPGASGHANNQAFRFVWSENPWSKGGYTCFTPGQYTAFTGAALPVGNLYFAGEHTSFDFQGYMEGGAVSGKQAARQISAAI